MVGGVLLRTCAGLTGKGVRRASVAGVCRRRASAAATSSADDPWLGHPAEWKYRVQVAAVIERAPVIHTEYNDFEDLYVKHWLDLNNEKTSLHPSEFEEHGVKYHGKKGVEIENQLQNERERLAREEEERKYQGTKGFATAEEAEVQEKFVPAPKLTEDENDHRSLNRRLMGYLYLIVKDKHTGIWRFPQGPYRTTDGEFLRLSAKRQLQDHIGKRLRVHMIGNVPRHYIVDTPDDSSLRPIKTFFYHGRYRIGDVKWNQEKVETHAWVNRKEMRQYFGDEYFESIEPMLFVYNEYPSPKIAAMS